MTKSIYQMLMEGTNGGLQVTFSKEMIERLFEEWKKIDTTTTTLTDGRLKTKQKYPDLNDLIFFLWDKRGVLA